MDKGIEKANIHIESIRIPTQDKSMTSQDPSKLDTMPQTLQASTMPIIIDVTMAYILP